MVKFNENNYPMNYKEFEEKVVELFLESYSDDVLELMIGKVDDVLSEVPHNFVEQLYGYTCFRYDNPQLYGKDCKRAFEDSKLRQNAVSQLRLLIG